LFINKVHEFLVIVQLSPVRPSDQLRVEALPGPDLTKVINFTTLVCSRSLDLICIILVITSKEHTAIIDSFSNSCA